MHGFLGGKRSDTEHFYFKVVIFLRTEYILNGQLDLLLAGMLPDNRLVFRVMLRTGLRVSDVLNLKLDDISRCFWITEQKTGKRRQVGLSDELILEIKRRAGKSEWAFPSPLDARKHRTRQAVWADLKKTARAFRLPQNIGTHSARKWYAVELMRKYGDIESVQRALNHDNPGVTVLYAYADMLTESLKSRGYGKKRHKK